MPLRPVLLISLLIGFSNAVAGPVTTEILMHGPLALMDGAGVGLVIWAVAFWCFYTLIRTHDRSVASRVDILPLIISASLIMIPSAMAAWFASFIISFWGFYQFRENKVLRSVCLIFAALAMRVPVTTLTLGTVSEEFLAVDAFLVQLALMLTPLETQQIGNIIVGTDGHKLAVMTGCSSFTNVSMALLAWFAISHATCHQINRRAAVAGICVAFAIISLNVVRLSLMAVNADLYTYIHDGDGKHIFELSLVLSTLFITIAGTGGSDAHAHHVGRSIRAIAR